MRWERQICWSLVVGSDELAITHHIQNFQRLYNSLSQALVSRCSKSMLKAISTSDNDRDITVALVGGDG